MRKRLLLLAACALCASTLSSCAILTQRVVFTKTELQAKIGKKFPIERDVSIKGMKVLTFTLSSPEIFLREGSDRIAVRFRGLCDAPGSPILRALLSQVGTATVMVAGGIEYDQKERQFFFRQPVLEEFKMPGLPELYEAAIMDSIKSSLTGRMDRVMIYDLKKGEKPAKLLAGNVLKAIEIHENEVVAVLDFW